MGWSYEQLHNTPAYLIEQAFLFLEREAVYSKSQES
jgi:hypothetical protein